MKGIPKYKNFTMEDLEEILKQISENKKDKYKRIDNWYRCLSYQQQIEFDKAVKNLIIQENEKERTGNNK